MADIKAPALSPATLKLAEHIRNVWSVTIPPGIPVTSLQAADFWAHCASRLKPYERIECRAQDNAWFAELMVGKVAPQAVQVWVLSYVDLKSQAAAPTLAKAEDFAVTFGGPKHLWRVIRASDKTVIHHGEATEGDAKAWLEIFLSMQAA